MSDALSTLGGFVSGYVPMLMLGTFQFSLNVAVFQEMQRSTEYKWPAQERFSQQQARQFTGMGDDTITLPGVIYPEYKGSTNAMKTLRGMAQQGQPYLLLDGTGQIYGRWVVLRIEETRSVFAMFTQPLKIDFSVTLGFFDGNPASLLPDLSGTLLGAAISAV